MRLPSYDAAFWRSFARWGATRLPRWWLRGSPGLIGAGMGLSQPIARAQVMANLRLVLGPRPAFEEAFDAARTFAEFGHCLAEGLAASADEPPRFDHVVEGQDYLLRAFEARRGAIMVTAHTGSWDVSAAVMVARGFEVAIAMAAEPDAAARAISDEARTRAGVRIFHVGDDPLSALPLARHVRQGGALALQIDRVPSGMRAYHGTLFGKPWAVPVGPFQLAMATGAPIIPVFAARMGFLRYLVHADPWIHVPKRATEAEIGAAVQRALRALEGFVKRFPTQWFHFAPHPKVEAKAVEREVRAAG